MSDDGIKRESKWDRMRAHQSRERFTEEALKAQDGRKVPLTLEPGGPVIGEATLKYDSDEKALKAEFTVDDPVLSGFLKGTMPYILGKVD